MASASWASPAEGGRLVQALSAATECEVDLVRKRPDHGIGLRPWMPQQPTEFCSHPPLTRTSPCEVDRLTRALSDFAKLVDVFDRRGVSFVSITQQFNTTTSMGRLTLNVLLSFA